MKTTVDIDDELLKRAMRIYGVKTKKQAIEMGLRELIEADQRRRLADAFGSQPDMAAVRRRRSG